MILRKFMQHIREQNWFAVGLDVLVVIVGIFLGLQVQAWYDGRVAIVEEARTIEYFIADLEKNNTTLLARNDYMNNQIAKGEIVLRALKEESLAEADRMDFEHGIIMAGRMEPLTSFLNSLNTENLNKIRDFRLRRILDSFVGYMKRTDVVEDNIKVTVHGTLSYVNSHSGFSGNTYRDGISFYDFETLKNDPIYKASFANVHGKIINYQIILGQMISEGNKMIEVLKAYQAGEELPEVEFQ